MTTAQAFWEDHYGAHERRWSGRVNAVLADVVTPLPPGTVLDLGCGEGGDAVWLAQRGWRVTAVDVSAVALERLAEHAAAAGVTDRITVERHDLAETFPTGEFDLVSAQFLQSPIAFPRVAVLRRAAAAVAPGGLLLVVEHGSAPAWRQRHDHGHGHGHDHHDHTFSTPEGLWAELDLPAREWTPELVAAPTRTATGPGGERAELVDAVVAARRAVS